MPLAEPTPSHMQPGAASSSCESRPVRHRHQRTQRQQSSVAWPRACRSAPWELITDHRTRPVRLPNYWDRCRSRFHNKPYKNLLIGILPDTGRPRKSGTRALPADPMPSPGVMGASAIRQVCSPEIRLTEVRPPRSGLLRARLLPVGPRRSDPPCPGSLGADQPRGAASHTRAPGAHRPRPVASHCPTGSATLEPAHTSP